MKESNVTVGRVYRADGEIVRVLSKHSDQVYARVVADRKPKYRYVLYSKLEEIDEHRP